MRYFGRVKSSCGHELCSSKWRTNSSKAENHLNDHKSAKKHHGNYGNTHLKRDRFIFLHIPLYFKRLLRNLSSLLRSRFLTFLGMSRNAPGGALRREPLYVC